jgi:hypothetical protein
VTPGFLGRSVRQAGKSYTVVATPKAGYLFEGWEGTGVNSKVPALTFTMPEKLEISARFIRSPFVALKGSWAGLLASTPVSHAGAGLFTLTTQASAAFSGQVQFAGQKFSFKGSFNVDGASLPISISRGALPPLSLTFKLMGPNGIDGIQGSISDGGTLTSSFLARRSLFTAAAVPVAPLRNVPASWIGKYTLLIEPTAPGGPEGSGYASLTVLSNGSVKATGKLADGSTLSAAGFLSIDGYWPFFLALNKGADSLSGEVTWYLDAESDFAGELHWFKAPSTAPTAAYPAGWPQGSVVRLRGAHYTPPKAAKTNLPAVPPLSDLNAESATGNLRLSVGLPQPASIERPINLSMAGKFTPVAPNSPLVQLSLVPATGLFTGSIILPGTTPKRPFSGALLQKTQRGAGYHIGGGKSGGVSLALP